MTSIIILFNIILIFNIQISLSQPLSCSTYEGTLSSIADDALSFISCPSHQPLMVSCGYYSEGGRRDGGFISDSKCYAQNGHGGSGAKPYATCCSITGGASCIDISDATLTNPVDDQRTDIYCPSDYELTGCTARSYYTSFDGILPYDDIYNGSYCRLQASVGINPLIGYARCCKPNDITVKLSCNVTYGTSTGLEASVTCPPGLIMTGCSAIEHWNQLSRWYVEDNTCKAKRLSSNSKPWNIGAICCAVTTPKPTKAPTEDPTIDPTADPTVDPTNDPTADPTVDPTVEPTVDPTNDPTSDPTVDPTADPTADPTTDPTVDPTADPTNDPTIDPTVEPTTDPTADPTADPTSDPTVDPTADPTSDPTRNPTIDPTRSPTADGCDFDINAYLDRCYCVESEQSETEPNAAFDQFRADPQNYFEQPANPGDENRYNYNQIPKGPNDDVILTILYINSFAIMVLLVLVGYLIYINGCSKGRVKGYGKVYDTEYDSELRAINA